MRILRVLFLLLFSVSVSLWALEDNTDPLTKQMHLDVQMGTLLTFDTFAGFRGGLTFGIPIDKLVTMGLTVDYYRSTFQYPELYITNSSVSVEGEGFVNSAVFLLNFRVYYPQVFFEFVVPYGQVGLGYGIAFADYSYRNGEFFGSYHYGDFAMNLYVGAKMAFGEKTDLFLQLGYVQANLKNLGSFGGDSWTLAMNKDLNLSGLNLTAGISFRM